MQCQPYGFLIDNAIHIDIRKKNIYRFHNGDKAEDISVSVLYINDTMMRLFSHLLINAVDGFITKEDVLKSVWDEHNLSSSGTRLWQVFTALKHKLSLMGLPDDFIIYENRKGYTIRYNNIITLYSEVKENKNTQTLNTTQSRRASTLIHLRQQLCQCADKKKFNNIGPLKPVARRLAKEHQQY